jgi:arsenate reductase (glutaredoxin)
MAVTIYHNPNCSTSRKVLGWLKDKGIQPKIVEYLKAAPSAAEMKRILAQMKAEPHDILRRKGEAYGLRREHQPRQGAAFELRADLQASAVGLDQVLHDRQAEPGAGRILDGWVLDPAKGLERHRDLIVRHADAGVGDGDGDRPILHLLRR